MPEPKRFLVRWEVDVEDVETAREAAETVWREYFGRSLPPEPDSCCVFEVNGETVDLEKPEEPA